MQDLSSVKLVFLPPNAASVLQQQTGAQLKASRVIKVIFGLHLIE
jgi:hypothetical protein